MPDKNHRHTHMSKAIVIPAVFSHEWTASNKTKVYAFVLDGSPEQHDAYRARVASSPDPKRAAVAEHEYTDQKETLPELVGNPMFYTMSDPTLNVGDAVPLTIPEDESQQPFIDTSDRDREIARVKKLGGDLNDAAAIWDAHLRSCEKMRFTKKNKKGSASAGTVSIDDLDAQDKE